MDLTTQVYELAKDIKEMREDITQLKGYMDRQNDVINELMKGHQMLMKRLVKQEEEDEEEKNIQRPMFPLMTQEDLDNAEAFIGIDDRKKDEMVRFLKPLLMPVGLKQKIVYVLSEQIILDYNLEGTHGKKRMLQYQKLLSVLYTATDRPGWSYKLFLDDLRRGFQFGKKKHFRKKCNANKLLKASRNPLSSGAEDDNDTDY
ncbi:uncharacterized protein LOC101460495 [Ceratitis capitata]|uniref:(Mediterranean fruit fly) hypothetical protein n=1 Tax=Ceratitis capitata TaxID=7213 RepID=W8C1T6_CERCA|nr:uncharacterized protein LOC101460495 [Ceratitis capitata]XP_004530117.1 uncharacterized protein LOC101460495 [Ceratitis capitata]CAD6993363.1 unnamed protein product [Ceratitis capitata]